MDGWDFLESWGPVRGRQWCRLASCRVVERDSCGNRR